MFGSSSLSPHWLHNISPSKDGRLTTSERAKAHTFTGLDPVQFTKTGTTDPDQNRPVQLGPISRQIHRPRSSLMCVPVFSLIRNEDNEAAFQCPIRAECL